MRIAPIFLSSFLFASILPCQITPADPGTSYHFKIHAPVSSAQRAVLEREFDLLHTHLRSASLEVVVLPEELKNFQRLGLRTSLIARGRPFRDIVAGNHDWPPDPNYYTVQESIAAMDKLVQTYPGLAKRINLSALPGGSKTHNGQSIFGLKISDNVSSDEDEPAILMASQHHCRELNSPVIILEAMKRILGGYSSDPKLKSLVDSYELILVPTVNPDGVDYVWSNDNMWRKNRRNNGGGAYGVDLNRNYSFLWGRCGASSSTRSSTYKGPSAGSEPEVQTMMAVAKAYRPEIYLDFHSSGQEVLFTYAPCATVDSTIRSYLNSYANDLRAPMNYRFRAPSASGEAPEFHWADTGAMSFLVEISTSFQPTYSVTVNEEKRVWPGEYRVLTAWRPAVRGHIRSIYQNQPVETTISVTPNRFSHGETRRSRARDGRYSLWLPIGSHTVSVSAPGHRTQTRTVQITTLNSPQNLDFELIPTNVSTPTLTLSGTHKIGTTTRFTYSSPGDAGLYYWVALSAGTTPGLIIGSRTIPLKPDGLLFASATPGNLLKANLGSLPPSSQVTASLSIPVIPQFVGISLYAGGVTLSKSWTSKVKSFSAASKFTIRR
ncbi:MAG: M14 family zinc carboxypeptidase [Planctomycetota bacterium]|jgi:hypothetical protein|nr:M14 family zinc carboxypeptidase [Planctomycetota bacterium]